MPDSSLDDGLRKHRVDGLWEALQAIHDGDQDVTDDALFQLVHDLEPKLGAFGLLDLDTENFLGAVRENAERDVDGPVAHKPFVPDFHRDGVEKDERIERV